MSENTLSQSEISTLAGTRYKGKISNFGTALRDAAREKLATAPEYEPLRNLTSQDACPCGLPWHVCAEEACLSMANPPTRADLLPRVDDLVRDFTGDEMLSKPYLKKIEEAFITAYMRGKIDGIEESLAKFMGDLDTFSKKV